MKKAAKWEIVALVVVCLFSFYGLMARADDGAPTDYKNLEGGKWRNQNMTVSTMRGNLSFDVTITIDKVEGGKITGTLTSKEKFDKAPQASTFSSDIQKAPTGKLRFDAKSSGGNSYRYDLQDDGSFLTTGPHGISGVLKRVTE
jgi:hypothetical protein